MKPWSYWFADLLPALPGCPSIQVQHELRRAAQTFFEATKAWKVIEAARPVTAGTATMSVAPLDAGQELVQIMSALFDGTELDLMDLSDMPGEFGPAWQTHTGRPRAYLQLTPGEIRLYPIPVEDAATGLSLTLAVKPSDTATGLPDDMAIKYRDTFNVGAKARLMILPEKPWTNKPDGAAYGLAFDALCGTGAAQVFRSFGRGRKGARPSWC